MARPQSARTFGLDSDTRERSGASNGDEARRDPQASAIADLVAVEDRVSRQKQLIDRIAALIGQRRERYSEAQFVIEEAYALPEATAYLIKSMMLAAGLGQIRRRFSPQNKPDRLANDDGQISTSILKRTSNNLVSSASWRFCHGVRCLGCWPSAL